jgi:glycosyltransferase involved in cell wall biosynthesis
MRILNVTQSYAPFFEFGGPPVKVRALAEGLSARGHQVTVLTSDWGLAKRLRDLPNEPLPVAGPFGPKREVNGVSAIYLPNWLHYHAISWNPALGRYLRARLRNFDLVHIFGLYDLLGIGVAAECRKRKIPYVVEPIGMFVPIVRNVALKRIYHRLFGQNLLNGAAAIIATSLQERTELESGGIPREKIILRRNGVSIPDFLPERGAFRKSHRIPPDSKLLLFLGRLSQKKSPRLLLGAFAEVCARQRSFQDKLHLAFVGPDESGTQAALRAETARLGLQSRVHFIGPLGGQAKWSAYRDADIFVLPSQNENFGNTAAEAVVAGTPVILTDRCGIAPLIANIAGLAVPYDQSSLSEAIERLLIEDSLYSKLKAGCSNAVASLDWEEPLETMELLYRSLAGPRQS